MTARIEIVRIPALEDNYVWLVGDIDSGVAVVVDPAVAPPVIEAARLRGWTIGEIWNTHWHGDHIGGNAEIVAATGASIVAPRRERDRIPAIDLEVQEGAKIGPRAIEATVWEVPGHTGGHVAYHLRSANSIFVGDTLFAMGCGRLFEGTAAQMWTNMVRLASLPDSTAVYCAHEYTVANGRFASTVERENREILDRLGEVEQMRLRGDSTVPTTIGLEKRTNPFMRAGSPERLAELRLAKDIFA